MDSLNELQLGECSNDDSSYDSDFGGDDDANGTVGYGHHHDVSRTTSDTLGAEYSDYVSAAAYKSRVDFALKLGYTERLVQAALSKVGTEPTQDQLLAVRANRISIIIIILILFCRFVAKRAGGFRCAFFLFDFKVNFL